MTNTLPSTNGTKQRPKRTGARAPSACRRTSARRPPSGWRCSPPSSARSSWTSHGLRDPLNRGLRYGVQDGVLRPRRIDASVQARSGLGKPPTRLKPSGADYFDLTPDDEQKMIVETVAEFAEEMLRPAAHDADAAATYPARPDRQGRRDSASPRSTSPRTSTGSPRTAARSPTRWSPRPSPTATWAWPCRSSRRAASRRP